MKPMEFGLFLGTSIVMVTVMVLVMAMAMPALAQSGIEESGSDQNVLLLDVPGVAVVNQTFEVLVTSREGAVSGAIVFFSTQHDNFQQKTDERGIARFTPGATDKLFVLVHKEGYPSAEAVVEVREIADPTIAEPQATEPTDAAKDMSSTGLPGFGCAMLIAVMLLAHLIIRNR